MCFLSMHQKLRFSLVSYNPVNQVGLHLDNPRSLKSRRDLARVVSYARIVKIFVDKDVREDFASYLPALVLLGGHLIASSRSSSASSS